MISFKSEQTSNTSFRHQSTTPNSVMSASFAKMDKKLLLPRLSYVIGKFISPWVNLYPHASSPYSLTFTPKAVNTLKRVCLKHGLLMLEQAGVDLPRPHSIFPQSPNKPSSPSSNTSIQTSFPPLTLNSPLTLLLLPPTSFSPS